MAEDQDVIIKLIADRSSASQTQATVARIKNDIRAAFDGNATTKFQSNIKSLNKEFADLQKNIGKAADEKERLESGGSKLGAIDQIASATSRGLGGIGIGGNIGGAVGGIGDIAQLAQDFPRLKAAVADLPAAAKEAASALGAGGIGLVGGMLALVAVTKLAEAVNEQYASTVRAVLQGQEEYFRLIETGTTESINAQLEKLKVDLKIQQDIIARDKFYQEELQKQVGGFISGVADVFNLGGVQENRKAIEAAQVAAGALETQIGDLEKALGTGEIAANDAAAAEKVLADARAVATERSIKYIVDQKKFEQEAAQLSSDQIKQRQLDIKNEQERINLEIQARQAAGDTSGKLDELVTRLAELGNQEAFLIGTASTLAKAREEETNAAKAQADALKEVDKINSDSQAVLNKKNEDIIALNEKLAQSLDDLKKSYDQANLEAANAQLEKQNDLITQNNQDKTDAETSLNDDLIKIREDYQKRVKEIEKEFNRSSTDAIQDRDAVALDAAERKRSSDLDAAATQKREDENARRTQYAQQLRDLQTNLVRQQTELRAAYERENALRFQKYQIDAQQLRVNNQRETDQRAAAYNKQLSDLSKYLTQRSQTEQGYFGAILAYAKSVKDSIANMLGGGTSAVGNGAVTNAGDLFSFASGGTITKSGLVGVHKGEVILNRRQQAQGFGGGVNVAVSGVGLNRNNILRLVEDKLNAEFDAAGF